ncbi:MAG: tRNA (adenosine(37)-N6)-threonylcarbamoyltransferase complex dimerization subunit type 1 TsaB [Alphaproteobacteria bacterium]|nr:tRNA (adenosine(37)-N6)-threonylcarbamoyltransferase complex dimerization subunit type 1 TsaB [Alphaproteobacteria bacterium]
MYILAFDTTAAQCSIVLQKDNTIISSFREYMNFGQSEVLIPQMENMLKSNNLSFADINMVLVCVGPGSFTGVRAGIAVARTFQLVRPDLLLDGVSSFEAYVLSLLPEERGEINAVIIETKRDDFYIQLFDKNLQKITPPQALVYDDIIPLLRHKKISMVGDGVERFLSRNSGLSLHCIKMPDGLEVTDMIKAGLNHLAEGKLDYPKPLYLRAPDVSTPKSTIQSGVFSA